MSDFALTVHGAPKGQPRARAKPGQRPYKSGKQRAAERQIRDAWEDVGSPRLHGPISVHLTLYVSRPQSHFRKDGSLSTAGQRKPLPDNKKPDVDNALKLVMDALNERRGKRPRPGAWSDDVRVVFASVSRRWSSTECTYIYAAELRPQNGESDGN